VRQVTVVSFTPSVRDQELHTVFHFPDHGKPRKLRVVGSILAQIVDGPTAARSTYVIEPAFVFDGKVALGTDYMDSASVIAVPSGWADEARAVDEYKRRTKV
jgi:hypothetical protein